MQCHKIRYNARVMLKAYSNQKIVEKILTAKNGVRVRAVFLVTEENGVFQAKILSIKPLPVETKAPVLKCASPKKVSIKPKQKIFEKIVSPYINLFSFFNSQPTRAPSR